MHDTKYPAMFQRSKTLFFNIEVMVSVDSLSQVRLGLRVTVFASFRGGPKKIPMLVRISFARGDGKIKLED